MKDVCGISNSSTNRQLPWTNPRGLSTPAEALVGSYSTVIFRLQRTTGGEDDNEWRGGVLGRATILQRHLPRIAEAGDWHGRELGHLPQLSVMLYVTARKAHAKSCYRRELVWAGRGP